MTNTHTQFKPADGVLSQEVDGEIVLLDLQGERYFGLNEIGARVWSLLSDGVALDHILESLEREYDVAPGQLATDISILLDQLQKAGLVTPA